jgi:hypothetical protein
MENNMEKRFAIAYDGFVQREHPYTFEEAKAAWNKDILNRWLYEYDCSVYELAEDGSIKGKIPYEKLRN